MNIIFKAMLFSILLNLSVGIMLTAIPGMETHTKGLFYSASYTSDFNAQMNGSVDSQSQVAQNRDLLDRVLDKLTLGVYDKVKNIASRYLFGFIIMMESMIGGDMDEDLRTMVFGGLKTLIIVGNSIMLLWFITGKKLTGGNP